MINSGEGTFFLRYNQVEGAEIRANISHNSLGSSLPLEAPSSGQNILPSLPVAQALVSGSNLHNSNNLVRTVNPGDRVNIPCSLANVGGSIQFAKDDQPIILDSGCAHCQLDISNDGQASLTINRVSRKDQGHWQCWRLDNGKVINKIPIIQLVITNSPELPILIVNDKELVGGNNLDATITVKENEIVNFKCVIKGATTPVDYVHWMLDSSQNVTQMSQLIMEYSVENNYITQSLLKLNATKSMNLKSISCLSNHQLWLTPMTVTAFLNILYEPSFTISREPGFGVPVIEGMQVILKCEIDSNPSSSPIWIKDADNKTTTNSANNNAAAATNNNQNNNNNAISSSKEASGEPIVLYTQDDGSVIFQPAQKSDSGWYRCKTENKYGNFSSFGYYLNVRPAGTTSSQQQQQQQTPVHQPQPQQPIGQQQQQQYQQSPRFSISQTQPQPQQPVRTVESIYNSNPGGKIMAPNQAAAQTRLPHSNHFTPPSNNIINNDQPSVISSPSLFASTPPALPPPLPLPMPFNPNFANAIGGQNANMAASSNLCKPNSGGRIDGFPEIDHPVSTVQAVLGRHLILPLRFCCNPGPARVFWIHRHLAMIPGRMFGPYITRDVFPSYNSFYCFESTFEIESVKPEDIGTVYVFVSNEKGHAGAQINIQLAAKLGTEQGLLGPRFQLPASSSSSAANPTNFLLLTCKQSQFHLIIFSFIMPLLTILVLNCATLSSSRQPAK